MAVYPEHKREGRATFDEACDHRSRRIAIRASPGNSVEEFLVAVVSMQLCMMKRRTKNLSGVVIYDLVRLVQINVLN